MSKVLYDSPDVSSIDYTDTIGSNSQRGVSIDERRLARRVSKDNKEREILDSLSNFIRKKDMEAMGGEGGGSHDILVYLEENIPNVEIYMAGLPENATDDDKIGAITQGLEERSKVIDEYNNRVICEAPFLGNEVEEARSKLQTPEAVQRYKSQYERIPTIRSRESGRSAVKTYKVQRNPKSARLKLL